MLPINALLAIFMEIIKLGCPEKIFLVKLVLIEKNRGDIFGYGAK